ncbi:hypothetical protein [Bythopirellula goksoeyrii]|uniref:Glycosyl hydrolase family 76 n=1 Tax=Bythopirellula goksoeyrii TaxID=1400387 RepID=A0A5B9QC49_9BACT|nr:hypothetical protein [Bythopirellula goksoeyrii]QEG35155.1 hypothetical protein Pr1d_24460 [Bythopirellula goksoeyrii]
MPLARREFIKNATLSGAASLCFASVARSDSKSGEPEYLRNARWLGDRFIKWQAPYGGTDPKNCPYRTKENIVPTIIQGIGPQVRALYALYDATGIEKYKVAADRHAVFMMNAVHDPPVPYHNKMTLQGEEVYAASTSWQYGKVLSPCYDLFVKHNPDEHVFDLKAYSIFQWLQAHRRDDSYFGVGYPNGEFEDAQFSCDLGEVGSGLVGYYEVSDNKDALKDAFGLAKYFLTEHEDGSAAGVWSSKIGTWLVGPWPGGGAEHFTSQQYDQTGWGWSCLVVGEFLLELRELTDDDSTRKQIAEKCVKAFQWCIDHCQFDDGAHGMFGKDDKWVGQAAAAILLYTRLLEQDLVPPDVQEKYGPKIQKSWCWMLNHTGKDTYPTDGYIKVTGSTTTKPPENLLWMMSWTVDALLAGGEKFTCN